ncbi:6-cysteine protein [Plasmodium chabaudi chabaudi]|uniref:6-cysteine protein n=1 Tax=Plasmodium chabaudi chabaudi TaxID=31271 RepID=A0A1C6XD15_PLACU|nr:6-cysteine protein [Plasmodium chabaudi chabaudi]
MKGLLIYTFIFLLKQLIVRSEEYVCDFRAKNYLHDNKDMSYCTINAKPFDKITYICPNKIGAQCFHNVNTSNNIKTHLESSQIHINYLLYGSTIYKDTLIVPPTVPKSVTFYCFCQLETDVPEKSLKPPKFEGVGNHNGNITLGESVTLDNPMSKALYKQNKYKNLMEEGDRENGDETIIEMEPETEPEPEPKAEEEEETEEKAKAKENKPKPKIIKVIYKTIKGNTVTKNTKTETVEQKPEEPKEAEAAKEEPAPAEAEPVKKIKYGVMKVTVQKASNVIKGCDFGSKSTQYFTNPLANSKDANTKLCQINAKPGEIVGFKCIQETHGYVEPSGCFDNVYVNNYNTSLNTIIPGYTSYASKTGSTTAFYLKLPHLINKAYTFECKCRSSDYSTDSYIFQVNVESGESDLIKKSFN